MSNQTELALTAAERIVEALLISSDKPLSLDALQQCLDDDVRPTLGEMRKMMDRLAESYREHSFELREVATGWRLQVRQEYSDFVVRLFDEKPRKYSRALLETLAIIAYRQPVTRGEIEEIRGVAVSSNVMRTLLERNWVRVIGHREVPGRPAMFGSTKEFLDYFNLQALDQLPSLAELQDIDKINIDLDLAMSGLSGPDGKTALGDNLKLEVDSKVNPLETSQD
jgi:segregation and condensation protein B